MAQPQYADNVSVTSTSTGTGTLVCGGATIGHQTFGTAFGISGNTRIFYGIKATTGEWETGIGTFLGVSNAVQRDTALDGSSGPGTKVNFPAGSKTVYCPAPALVPWTFQSRSASDITLELRSASAQSVPVLQTYDSGGEAAFRVMPDGLVVLAAEAGEMLRIGTEPTGAKYVALRNDLLGAPGNDGVRWRLSGTGGTTGFWQVSSGDTGFAQLQPSTGELKFVNNIGDPGATFVEGISIRNANASIGGVLAGHVAFDCAGETASTSWDIGPAHNGGSGNHTVRLGRRSGTNTTVNLVMLSPGTTTSKVTLSSNGSVTADAIQANSSSLILRSGTTTGTIHSFRDSSDNTIAHTAPDDTSLPNQTTLATRRKGDARWAAISSLRFKEQVFKRDDLAGIFDDLKPRSWVWGGEVPPDDERFGMDGVGFIAEDVVEVLPEAGRYVREDDGELRLHGLDPMALIAVLHAKIAELEARIAKVEGAA